ncbi:vacuolar sorting-associated protein [Poronia punctata]|nr:vacuolar sorting-associated protein [Poronia punctata]
MNHFYHFLIAAIVFVSLIFTLTTLPRALNPVPPSKEKIEADERWVNTSPYWLDRQACRWLSLCGLMHVRPDKPTRAETYGKGTCGNVERRAAVQIKSTTNSSSGSITNAEKEKKKRRRIPDYVLNYAPLVHLYSDEHFWPSDIQDHIQHVTPYIDDTPLNLTEPLSLANLGQLNSHQPGGGILTLKSNDNVECRPTWLHSTANIPVPFPVDDDDEEDEEEGEYDTGSPEKQPLDETTTTWYDVDKTHPLRRIADPRKVPRRKPQLLTREQRRIAARSEINKPNREGYSKAPATLILVDKGSDIVDAFWFFFYAYNLGQTVLGTRYGNHVGDWEHAMIRFESGVPRAMFFSEHEGGQAYAWQAVEKKRNREGDGNGDGNGDGLRNETRPVLYSAVGSHAMYAMQGDHPYVLPFKMLKDQTDRGPLWDPSMNFRSYWYDYEGEEGEGLEPSEENPDAPVDWFHYKGQWGDKMYGLDDERQWRLFGQYHYVTGPQGPKYKSLGRRKVCQKSKCRILHSIAEGQKSSWHS